MHIESVPNRNSRPCLLIRESYREGKKVRKRTLANVTNWPRHIVEGLRVLFRGGKAIEDLEAVFDIAQSRPYGHVAAVLASLRKLGLDKMIARKRSRSRDLVVAMIVGRILDPGSKLAMARGLDGDMATSALGDILDLGSVHENELYAAMDWLLPLQETVEKKLCDKHLKDGSLVLYDVTSTYFEGRTCPLAMLGHNRDGKKGKLQIVVGLLCNVEGCPVAVEVFDGNTGDPSTLSAQIDKLRNRFGLKHVIIVADRGLITQARIDQELRNVEGLDWITALRAPAIAKLVDTESLQLSLFDDRDLAEISSPDYPGERLIACRNPFLAEERKRKRKELIAATARELDKVVLATQRSKNPPRKEKKIAMRVGKIIGRFKVAKYFDLEITDESFSYELDEERIARDRDLDGIYLIRTSVPGKDLSPEDTVRAYKSLSNVEKAFRTFKSVDLKIRPIHHNLADRVRAHVFLCMLAYHVEWHMRENLASMLFQDDDKKSAELLRHSVVAPAQRSEKAMRKAITKKTESGLPVHSFAGLMANLATIVRDRIEPKLPEVEPFYKTTRLSAFQQKALDLLGVRI